MNFATFEKQNNSELLPVKVICEYLHLTLVTYKVSNSCRLPALCNFECLYVTLPGSDYDHINIIICIRTYIVSLVVALLHVQYEPPLKVSQIFSAEKLYWRRLQTNFIWIKVQQWCRFIAFSLFLKHWKLWSLFGIDPLPRAKKPTPVGFSAITFNMFVLWPRNFLTFIKISNAM